jgi:hypothetical protein
MTLSVIAAVSTATVPKSKISVFKDQTGKTVGGSAQYIWVHILLQIVTTTRSSEAGDELFAIVMEDVCGRFTRK